jgi:hypothetical protein
METTMKIDPIRLIEYGASMAKPSVRPRTEKKEKDVDVLALLETKRREYVALKNFVDEQVKINKPDDKKKPESIFNVKNIAMFLIATTPITGPLYVAWFRLMLG